MNLEERIRKKMETEKVSIEGVDHEPVYTNPAMALALGIKESQTVKLLVLKTTEGKFAVFVLPGDRVGSGVTPAPYHTTVHAGRHTAVRERLSEATSFHWLSALSTAVDVRCSLSICSRVPPATLWESSGISALLSASFSSIKARNSSSLPRSGLHHCAMAIMPSADFYSPLMPPLDSISLMADEQISPGITHSLSPHLPVASTSTPSG